MVLVAFAVLGLSSVLEVGPNKAYDRIEAAVARAKPGTTIRVFPGDYRGTHVRLTVGNVQIVGMSDHPVPIDGAGFEYSGAGSVPRAIFQIDAPATDVTIENFELKGAHNASHNGAGVRINAANRVTIRNCTIHGNDMGIMSNGQKNDPHAGEDQLIDRCRIYKNGDPGEPGQNHNLYLGGTSVTVQFCDIWGSLTGHNLKSRAHFTLVQYCQVHDSSNREFDFVEAWDTERRNSNAVLVGNVVAKAPDCPGNRGVIHFGQERGTRNGVLFAINNTIESPFSTPIFALDPPTVRLELFNNIVAGKPEAPREPFYLDGQGKKQPGRPTYRYMGNGKWTPTKEKFVGAG